MAADAERIARAFHDEYEAHAEKHGWETQEATRSIFDDLPAENRQTMLSTVQALLDRRVIAPASPVLGDEERERLTKLELEALLRVRMRHCSGVFECQLEFLRSLRPNS